MDAKRKDQLAALYNRLRESRADCVEAQHADDCIGDPYIALMDREQRLTRLIQIVKHAYRTRR